MRNTILLLLLSVFQVFAGTSYSQSAMLSLNLRDVQVKDVLTEIEEQSEFYFLYNSKLVDVHERTSISAKEKKINDILDQLFGSTDVEYVVFDRQIILTKEEMSLKEALSLEGAQQPLEITGQVIDNETGEPLPGVNVLIEGTTTGTITDVNGNYTLTSCPSTASLVFSYVGYQDMVEEVSGRTEISVSLEAEVTRLAEVVAIGYGQQTRRKMTSAVSSVDMDETIKLKTSSISEALSGRAAGLTSLVYSAQPGGRVNLQIRGAATGREPLIVIDGMPTSTPRVTTAGKYSTGQIDAVLSTLNARDIKSIDILKDASATSIYGSKAAGGVILITTKSGQSVPNPEGTYSVNVEASVGQQSFTRIPEFLEALDFMETFNKFTYERYLYQAREDVYAQVPKESGWTEPEPYAPWFTEEEISEFRTGAKEGTDYLNEILENGLVQDYNLNVTGSHRNTRFYTSLSAHMNEGLLVQDGLQKYTGRVNVDQDFGERLTAGMNVSFSHLKFDNLPATDIYHRAMTQTPTLPVYDELGNYTVNPYNIAENPVAYTDITNISKLERFYSTLHATYSIAKGLSWKTQVGFDRNQNNGYSYLPSTTRDGAAVGGRADRTTDLNTNYQFQSLLSYATTFGGGHNFDGLLGTEYMKYHWETTQIMAHDFPFDGALWNNLRLGTATPIAESTGGSSEVISFFSRLGYNFDYKYFLTANLRVDGSSNFSPELQYGFFPGISAAWDISRESFMDIGWLDQLKLRVGYGETGNDQIGVAFYDWYSPGWTMVRGDEIYSGIGIAGFGNPDLKWEKQTDLNAGIDFSLFNGRLTGETDVFNRVISRILGQKNLGSWNPVSDISYNLDAKKQTYGVEFTLNSKNIVAGNFSWNSTATFTYYRDRWLQRDPSYILKIYESPKQYFNEIWLWETDGLVQADDEFDDINVVPGSIKLVDQDSYLLDDEGARIVDENDKPIYAGEPDGKMDDADLVKVGVNTPFTIGFNNTFRYRQFDLSVYAYGVFSQWKRNPNMEVNYAHAISVGYNMQNDVLDSWAHDNQGGNYPSVNYFYAPYGNNFGDYYLEEAWFIRVQHISLGYTLQFGKLKNLRVHADVMNPFLFTPYSGTDPETDSYYGAYPNHRTFRFGVELGF